MPSPLRLALCWAPLLIAGCSRAESSPLVGAVLRAPLGQLAALAPEAGTALSGRDLIEQRASLEGRTVTVDLYETLWDADHASSARPGEYVVIDLPHRLRLVGADWDPSRPLRRGRPLPRGLQAPLRVTAEVFADSRTARSSWPETVLRVVNSVPIALPTPEPLGSTAVLVREPARWEGRYVTVEAVWQRGFETTTLDGVAWLTEVSYVTRVGRPHDAGSPAPRLSSERVRVVGFVHTRGGRFGHLGQYAAELLATSITMLGPATP